MILQYSPLLTAVSQQFYRLLLAVISPLYPPESQNLRGECRLSGCFSLHLTAVTANSGGQKR
jgi:hypothetical protein